MFTKNQLGIIWDCADAAHKRVLRKTVGANTEEQMTMEFARAKQLEEELREIKFKANKIFRDFDEYWKKITEQGLTMEKDGDGN